MSKKMSQMSWDSYAYSIIIMVHHMSYGISIATYGPAYVDLKHVLNTSIYEIGLLTSFLSIGYLAGSLTGFLFKYLNRQITLILLTTCMAVSNGLTPYAQDVWQLYLVIFTYGLGAGVFLNSKNVWLVEIWQKKSGPVLQISGFMYGLGTIIGPLIDMPFLTGENIRTNQDDNTSDIIMYNLTAQNSLEDIEMRRQKLKTPFLISGIFQMIGPVLLTIMFLVKKYENKSKLGLNTNTEKIVKLFDRRVEYRNRIIILSAIFLAFYVSTESIYTQFAATYFQYIPLRLTAQQSAELFSAMSLTYTLSIGISSVLSMRVGPQQIILIYFGVLFTGLFVLTLGTNIPAFLWIGSLTMTCGLSPIYPSIYALVGQHMRLTNKIGTILFFSSEVLNLMVPFLLGTYIDNHPNVFIWSILTNISIIFVIFLVIIYLIRRAEQNYLKDELNNEIPFTITMFKNPCNTLTIP